MKRLMSVLVLILFVSAVFAQKPDAKPAAPVALTADEQREILDLQTQIDKLKLMQENAILRAANEHGVSMKKYEISQVAGQLMFTERQPVADSQIRKP